MNLPVVVMGILITIILYPRPSTNAYFKIKLIKKRNVSVSVTSSSSENQDWTMLSADFCCGHAEND